jgi:hypothetical protein
MAMYDNHYSNLVNELVTEMVRVLSLNDAEYWSVPAGSLEWSCWTTATHVAHDLPAYAGPRGLTLHGQRWPAGDRGRSRCHLARAGGAGPPARP